MKTSIFATVALAMLSLAAFGQPAGQAPADHPKVDHPTIPRPNADWPAADPADVASINSLIAAFYASTSGERNQPRQWDRYRSLFLPDARLVAARPSATGAAGALFLSPDEFVTSNKTYFEKGGFLDKEIARRVESFGSIAHVWSTFESRHAQNDPAPYARGITSMQLLKDGDRWWIVNIFWGHEREDAPIPEKYLTSPQP